MTTNKQFLIPDIDNRPFFILNKNTYHLHYFNENELDKIVAVEERAGQYPWHKKNFLSSIHSAHQCIALKCDGVLIAHTVISFSVGEAEVLIFSVDRELQGRGIGRHFLNSILRLCERKADQVFLEVRESNEAAIRLYDNVGFNQIGERPNYYPSARKNDSKSQRFEQQLSGHKSSARENALIFAKDL